MTKGEVMSTYVLIHGAGTDSWYWHKVAPQLAALGHTVIAPDLPSGDDSADFSDYADSVVEAIGDQTDQLVVVGQSIGGFTAPLVCDRVEAQLLILVASTVPAPGESAHEFFANTRLRDAQLRLREREGRTGEPNDLISDLFHDVPEDTFSQAMARGERPQSDTPFGKPWPLDSWPDVPIEFVVCRRDRLFPADYLTDIVGDRLGLTPHEIDSGHLPAFSQPEELVATLERLRAPSEFASQAGPTVA